MNSFYNNEPRREGPELHSSAAGGTPDSDARNPDLSVADTGETSGSPAECQDNPESENDPQTGSAAPAPDVEVPDQNDPSVDSERTPRSQADTREDSEIEDHPSSTPEAAHEKLTPDQSEQLDRPNVNFDIKVPPELERPVALILLNVEDRINRLEATVSHNLTEGLNQIQTNLDEHLTDAGAADPKALQQSITSIILEKFETEAVKKDQKIRELEEKVQQLSSDYTDYRQSLVKGNEVESFIQTLFPLYNNLVSVMEKFPQAYAGPRGYILRNDTELLVHQLLSIFDAAGVHLYQSEGDDLNSAEQISVGDSVPTRNREQHRKIATSVKQGFRTDTRILQHELVTVYIFHDDEGETS